MKFRLRIALPFFFTLFVVSTGVTIFSVLFFVSLNTLENISFDYLERTQESVIEKTMAHLKPVARLSRVNSKILSPELITENYTETFNDTTMPQFESFPQIALIYFGSSKGNFWLNGVEKDLTISTQVIQRTDNSPGSDEILQELKEKLADKNITPEEKEAAETDVTKYLNSRIIVRNAAGDKKRTDELKGYIYDPRWRPWYRRSMEEQDTIWTDAYYFSSSGRFAVSGKKGVTVASPVLSSKWELLGIVGIDLTMADLNDFMLNLKMTPNGRIVLFSESGQVLASNYPQEAAESTIKSIEAFDDEAFSHSYSLYNKQTDSNNNGFKFTYENKKYLASFSQLPEGITPSWTIGILVPEDDFIGELRKNILSTSLIAVGILIIVLIFSIFISRLITNPINQLTKEADKIKQLDLDGQITLTSLFKEIDNMTRAFANMKSGLRSFKKFVPGDIVGYLIKSGQEAALGGSHKQLTIFFSDLKDFTEISEQLNPDELVEHMGQYLESFSNIISNSNGTVDKYIGDAVMAFWNAPSNVEDHAVQACAAALECQKKLFAQRKQWRELEKPPLFARIGIHTGDVIVGNMGSESRLNYTIIGDAVNLASRLESLAKTYGVKILVSDATRELAHDIFLFRKMDRVVVKGKSVPVTIYELIEYKERANPSISEWIETFEQGLEEYFNRNWGRAVEFFTLSLEKNPKDRAAKLFLKRIEHLRTKSLNETWDGAWKFLKK